MKNISINDKGPYPMKYSIYINCLFLSLIGNICAAEITDIDSISHGKLATITGVAFGTKKTPAPLKFETFENKDNGGASTVDAPVPVELSYWIGRGGFYGDGKSRDMTISDTFKRHSSSNRAAKSYLATLNGVPTHSQQIWHNGIGFNKTGKVYANMWIHWEWVVSPTYKTADTYYQVKAFNISTSHDSAGNPVRPYLTEFTHFYYDLPKATVTNTQNMHRNGRVTHPDQTFYYNNNSIPPNFSGWVNVVLLSEPGTNDNNGIISDGWRIIEISSPSLATPYQTKAETNKNYLDDETKGINPIDSLKIGWFLGNNIQTGSMSLYYDDIYLDNTFARVEIGNNQTYINCTHREIQPPISWNDDKIQITANVAAFSSNDDLFLFVFNEKNMAISSSGYKLTTQPRPIILKMN